MSLWSDIRSQIPAARDYAYLMSASAGPMHPVAYAAAQETIDMLYQKGDICFEPLMNRIEQVRLQTAKFLNVRPEEIAFVGSSSLAMNLMALSLKENAASSGRVLTMQTEFPSSTLPWLHHGYELDFLQMKEGAYEEADLEASLRPEHDLIVSSHIQYCTGFRQDLDILVRSAKKYRKTLVVNATQSLGAFRVDASQIDFVCASIHKWLMCGVGLSIFKVNQDFLRRRPPLYGWLSAREPWAMCNHELEPLAEAKALELGCGPLVQIFSLGGMLEWITSIGGIEKISQRILELRTQAVRQLQKAEIEPLFHFEDSSASGIIMIPCREAKSVVEALDKQGVYVSARGEGIRLSVHFFNEICDVDRFIDVYREIQPSQVRYLNESA